MTTAPSLSVGPQRLHELFTAWVAVQPNALALQDPFIALSYLQLHQAAQAALQQLKSLGVHNGDRVLVVAENCVAVGALVLAISELGAWSVIVNARLSVRELDTLSEHSGARLIIYTCQVSEDANVHAERRGAKKHEWSQLGSLFVEECQPTHTDETPEYEDGVAAIIYTSGTSGAPKGVMLTHKSLIFAAATARDIRRIQPGAVIYGALPMAHVVGLSMQFLGGMAGGAAVLLEPRFSPSKLAKAFADSGVTSFTGVPAMFARVLEWSRESGNALAAPFLSYLCVAGSPLTPDLKRGVEETFGLPLNNGYGLTETSPPIAQTRIETPRKDCSVGAPIPGVQVRIVDGMGVDMPLGEVGTLLVKGPNVMKGYYRNPDLTAQVLDGSGWFNTGDLVRAGADGALEVVGRSKELIIRSGFNVYPIEVEQALNDHPQIVQSAVVGRTVGHNEEVVAFVETIAGSNLTAENLEVFLRARLSPYKIPSEIRFVEQLPSGPSGKILKAALKALVSQ